MVLEVALEPLKSLCALVAYYPDSFPILGEGYPRNVDVLVHLAGDQELWPTCRHYSYPDTERGFAESELDTYDKAASRLAWSRTLAVLRKGFGIEVDLEET